MRNCALNELFRFGINRGSCFIQHKNTRVRNDCACKADELFFTGRKSVSAFTHIAVIAVLHPSYHLIGAHCFGGQFNFFIGCVQPAVTDIFTHLAGEQMRRLQHIANVAVQPQHGAFAVVAAIYQNFPVCRLKKAAGKVYKRGFSRAGFPHNRHRCSCGNFQVKMGKDFLCSVRILKRHVLEFDIALQRLPVFFFRFKGCAVLFNDGRRVGNLRLQLQQVNHALDVRLCGDKVRNRPCQLLYRFKYTQRIIDKGG